MRIAHSEVELAGDQEDHRPDRGDARETAGTALGSLVQAGGEKKARLNCIEHLLGQFPCTEVEHPPIDLPPRVRHDDDVRHPVPAEIMVPERY